MIAYFDSSAFVPLLMDEPTSSSCRDIWESMEKRVSTRLLYVEATAALEGAARADRISRSDLTAGLERLEYLWRGIVVIELNERLMLDASRSARQFGLRGYDSVHCAAAFRINGKGAVAASSDKRLNEAWSDLGLAVFTPHA